ncbi:hypothetical protein J3458_013251 [Metarhizium acridum]|uniref:uncharacterized protein n=1 Tax=Metarhizium acridum TaxID=92637 RepID=UPI001C6C5AA8|nr:hypothetical protein J3458_013251 [Metarhizium acridum]
MIGDMKAVKMLGLTDTLCKLVGKLRKAELEASERFRKLLIWQILIGTNAPVVLGPFATFVTYAVIAKARGDETLLTAQAFSSLSLISLTTTPLIRFCEALPTCMQALYCLKKQEESSDTSGASSIGMLVRDEQEMSYFLSITSPTEAVFFLSEILTLPGPLMVPKPCYTT